MDEMEGNRGSRKAVQNKAGRTRKVETCSDRIRFRWRERVEKERVGARGRKGGRKRERGRGSVHAPVANVMIGSRKQKRQTLGPGLQVCGSEGPDKASLLD